MNARATLAVVVVLALAGCGGSDSPAPAKEKQPAPAEEGAPIAEHTPDTCMLKAGLESIEKPSKGVWTAFHPDGYPVRVKKFGSPAAAHRAVEASGGVAEQANFFGIFGPAQDQQNRAAHRVATCLLAF